MKITIIHAGMSEPSNSVFLASIFQEELKKHSFDISEFRLKDLYIEYFDFRHYDVNYQHEEDFVRIQQAMQKSDGVVFSSPVWNFGTPAHLKNLIDRMGSFCLDGETRSKGQLNGKPFFFLFTGGAPLLAWKGLMKKTTSSLPQSIRYFGGSPIGTFYEGRCTLGKGNFGLVVDQRSETLERVRTEAKKFAALVQKYHQTGYVPVKEKLTSTVMRWGKSIMDKVF